MVVDDHHAFREALRDLIAAAPGFVLVGEAGSGEDAVRAVDQLRPELVLMDVVMPGMGGIAAAGAIQGICRDVVVMLISVEDPLLYPGVDELGEPVLSAQKQDLCPTELRRAWETLRG